MCNFWVVGQNSGSFLVCATFGVVGLIVGHFSQLCMYTFWVVGHIVGHLSQLGATFGQWVIQWVTFHSYVQFLGSGSKQWVAFNVSSFWGSGSYSASPFIARCDFWVVGHFSYLCTIFGQWVTQWVTFHSYTQLLGSGSHGGSLFMALCNFWVAGHILFASVEILSALSALEASK